MTDNTILIDVDQRGVATLTINRSEVHNAFDDTLIAGLSDALTEIDNNPDVRVMVLRSEGKNFSAGADLRWMRRMSDYTQEENKADAMQLANMLNQLNTLSKPTIAQVQGIAFGGGVGLVSCCDMVVASTNALFSLSEVRLGIIPAVISPHVVAAIGERSARRYFMTAERFSAEEARCIGLVHEVAELDQLSEQSEAWIAHLLQAGPEALKAAKDLIFAVSRQPTTAAVIEDTADRITARRASDEGKEGLGAFLEKRKPNWIRD